MSSPAKRIAIVSSRYPYGSQEAYLSAELSELSKYFERIVVVPLRTPGPATKQRIPPGVEVLSWPLVSGELLRRAVLVVRARPKPTLRAIFDVLRSRDRGRAKNFVVALKALALAQWAMENGIEHVHAYWISAPATVAYIAATVAGITWSSTAHRWDIYERNAFDVKARTASFIRTISTRGTDDLGKRMPSLIDRIVQVRLGTVVPPPAHARATRRDVFPIICPAALVPVKGHADLLAALSYLRVSGVPVRCTLAGTGPLREPLEQKVRSAGLGDVVTFAGLVPQKMLHQWYLDRRFCAVVLASRNEGATAMEGVPSSLIEAMAFGVPVVATDSGSIGELIDDDCGRLVAAGDPRALADALKEIFSDPEAAIERARRAYDIVARQHDVRVQMRTFAQALAGTGGTL